MEFQNGVISGWLQKTVEEKATEKWGTQDEAASTEIRDIFVSFWSEILQVFDVKIFRFSIS